MGGRGRPSSSLLLKRSTNSKSAATRCFTALSERISPPADSISATFALATKSAPAARCSRSPRRAIPCRQLDVYGPSIKQEIYDSKVKALDPSSPHWGMSGFYASVLAPGPVGPGRSHRGSGQNGLTAMLAAERIELLLASSPDRPTAARFLGRLRDESPAEFDRIANSAGRAARRRGNLLVQPFSFRDRAARPGATSASGELEAVLPRALGGGVSGICSPASTASLAGFRRQQLLRIAAARRARRRHAGRSHAGAFQPRRRHSRRGLPAGPRGLGGAAWRTAAGRRQRSAAFRSSRSASSAAAS